MVGGSCLSRIQVEAPTGAGLPDDCEQRPMEGNLGRDDDGLTNAASYKISTPILHLRTRVVKAHEPMGVQALGAELAVK